MRVRRAGSPKFKDSTQSKPVVHEGSDAVVESGGACRDAVGGDSAVGSQAELVPERLPRAPSASRTLPSAVLPAAQARLRGVTRWSTVEAGYHQFFVSSPATDPTSVTATGDVFDSGPNLVVVHTGVAAGPVRVGVFVLSGPPPGIDGVWEATAVEEIEATDDLLVVTTLGDVADDLGTVPVPSTGRLMVRVSRRGREERLGPGRRRTGRGVSARVLAARIPRRRATAASGREAGPVRRSCRGCECATARTTQDPLTRASAAWPLPGSGRSA